MLAGIAGAIAFCAVAPFAMAAEVIERFESDISVLDNGSLKIVETIEYDFGEAEKHGVFRYIPYAHTEPASAWYLSREVAVEYGDILRNGEVEPYEVTDEGGYAKVRIGDPDQTVSGKHTYRIEYTLRGALMYPPQMPPEVYLDINGVGWDVPAKVVRATLRGTGITQERSCYKGEAGAGTSCTIRTQPDGSILFESTLLAPNETMTIANALTAGSVAVQKVEHVRMGLLALIISPLWLLGLLWYTYQYRTGYQSGRTIIPQYEPYAGVLPMQIGVLRDASLDPKDIAAAIVYLAEQGYLRMKKVERKVLFFFEVDDFEIELVKTVSPDGPRAHDAIVKLLFGSAPVVGSVVALSKLKSNQMKQEENHSIVSALEAAIIADLTASGFYEAAGARTRTFQWVMWGVAVALFGGLFIVEPSIAHIVALITAVVSGIIANYLTRRLTVKGYEALWHTSGFEEYLTIAEKDRIDFHNAPERKPEQFLSFLPYAIAFGVEEKWAEAFKDVAIPNPEWYQDATGSPFSTPSLVASLSGFSSALASSAGSSASSGGGSAGGGTGGGGGGSW